VYVVHVVHLIVLQLLGFVELAGFVEYCYFVVELDLTQLFVFEC
jgi:hypothetical protein